MNGRVGCFLVAFYDNGRCLLPKREGVRVVGEMTPTAFLSTQPLASCWSRVKASLCGRVGVCGEANKFKAVRLVAKSRSFVFGAVMIRCVEIMTVLFAVAVTKATTLLVPNLSPTIYGKVQYF